MGKVFNKNNIEKIGIALFAMYIIFIYLFENVKILSIFSDIFLILFALISIYVIYKNDKLKYNNPLILSFIFSFFCLISTIWAKNRGLAFSKGAHLILLSLLLFFTYNFFSQIKIKNSKQILLKIIMYSGIILSIYTVFYSGVVNYFVQFFNAERAGEGIINANINSVAYKSCLSFLLLIYFALKEKNKNYWLLTIMPLIIVIGTQSKKVLAILVLGLIILAINWIKSDKKSQKTKMKIILLILFLVTVLIALLILINSPIILGWKKRIFGLIEAILGLGKGDRSTRKRIQFLKLGIGQFIHTPILGMGIDNSRLLTIDFLGYPIYLHNNMIELLSGVGLVGFTLYYGMYYYIFKNLLKNKKDEYFSIILILFFSSIICDIGAVTYYYKITYIVLSILIILTENDDNFISIKKALLFLIDRGVLNLLADEKYLKIKYKLKMNENLNLENPKTFNEKLQWLKLYDRKIVYTKMVDKYEAKKYASKIIGDKYIIPTLGIYNSLDDIDFSILPNKFVIKCTHDSGGVYICKDKSLINTNILKEKINLYFKKNYYYINREWPYRNIKPRIIIEKYMEDNNSSVLTDYKIFCFNGKPKFTLVCSNRKGRFKNTNFYDNNWKLLSFTRSNHSNSKDKIPEPNNFSKMLELAEKLSENTIFVRADFYEINGNIYFGELTFYPSGGFEGFSPKEYDKKLGDMLKLPK